MPSNDKLRDDFTGVFKNIESGIRDLTKKRERTKGLCKCVLLSLIVFLALGSLALIILGSVCLNNEEYKFCGDEGGAAMMVLFGGLIVLFLGFYGTIRASVFFG